MASVMWNADRTGNRTTVRAKWINRLDGDTWKPVDCRLVPHGSGWGLDAAPFALRLPQFANGTAEFVSTNQWDIFERTKISDSAFSLRLTPVGVSSVPGVVTAANPTEIIYAGAYPFGDLIYSAEHGRAPRFQKLIRFNSRPAGAGDVEISFMLMHDTGLCQISTPKGVVDAVTVGLRQEIATELRKVNNDIREISRKKFQIIRRAKQEFRGHGQRIVESPVSFATNAVTKRGIGFKTAHVWDLSGKREPIKVRLTRDAGGTITLTKIVPRSFLNSATYPVFTDTTSTFYPDPHQETTTVDGRVNRNPVGDTWAAIRNGVGTDANDTATGSSLQQIGCAAGSLLFNSMYRTIFLFDTSAIADNDVITAATFSIKGYSKADGLGIAPDVCVYSAAPASNTALVASDYNSANFGSTAFATAIAYSSWATSAFNDFALNSSGLSEISVSGITKFGCRNANYDVADIAPTISIAGASGVNGYFADTSGTTQDPKLVVEHAAAQSLSRSQCRSEIGLGL
jgi:hypothetical protein